MLKRMTDLATLANASKGLYRCQRIHADGIEALRMKRMGLCAGLTVEVLGTGDPMIVAVGHSRLGLSRFLAKKIEVVALDDSFAGDAE